MKVISVINDKGGVGKTVTAVNTAAVLGGKGYKVLVIDLDRQANATEYLGIVPDFTSGSYQCLTKRCTPDEVKSFIVESKFKGISVIPAGQDLEHAEIQIAMDVKLPRETRIKNICAMIKTFGFDYVIIDCPPSLHAVAINAMVAADFIIIPVQISQFAIAGIKTVFDYIDEIRQNFNPNIKAGILFTIYENSRVMREVCEYFEKQSSVMPLFNSKIRKTTKLIESTLDHAPVVYYAAESTAAQDYVAFADELLERI